MNAARLRAATKIGSADASVWTAERHHQLTRLTFHQTEGAGLRILGGIVGMGCAAQDVKAKATRQG